MSLFGKWVALSVARASECPDNGMAANVWLPVFGIFNVHPHVMHATANGDYTDTVRESALKVDSGRKMPCRTMRVSVQSDALPAELSRPTFRSSELRVESTRTQIDEKCVKD